MGEEGVGRGGVGEAQHLPQDGKPGHKKASLTQLVASKIFDTFSGDKKGKLLFQKTPNFNKVPQNLNYPAFEGRKLRETLSGANCSSLAHLTPTYLLQP